MEWDIWFIHEFRHAMFYESFLRSTSVSLFHDELQAVEEVILPPNFKHYPAFFRFEELNNQFLDLYSIKRDIQRSIERRQFEQAQRLAKLFASKLEIVANLAEMILERGTVAELPQTAAEDGTMEIGTEESRNVKALRLKFTRAYSGSGGIPYHVVYRSYFHIPELENRPVEQVYPTLRSLMLSKARIWRRLAESFIDLYRQMYHSWERYSALDTPSLEAFTRAVAPLEGKERLTLEADREYRSAVEAALRAN